MMSGDQQHIFDENRVFDVIICGAGLAGLTLARQLKLNQPELSIAILERQTRPLPVATHTVGESTVELGAHYLATKLQLADYLDRNHLRKLGIRYFFGDGNKPLDHRPELGVTQFPLVSSYQIDRGVLENDLRAMSEALGIILIEGMSVMDIQLSDNDSPHVVSLLNREQVSGVMRARWVVDAMGRRRMLQRKLALGKGQRGNFSSVWFRFSGRVDVADLSTASAGHWHERVPDKGRYFSTNHMMGKGYWVWLIPLSSGNTSVGIVTDESVHPFETYRSFAKAMTWLGTHESILATYLSGRKPLDFKGIRHYSYSSHQVFSDQRWACVGESGVFADPYYSPGTDLIGFANTMTTDLIRRDLQGSMNPELVTHYNRVLISMNDSLTRSIQSGYSLFGSGTVTAAKFLWDVTAAWSFNCPQMFNDIYLSSENHKQLRHISAGFSALSGRIHRLLASWEEHSKQRLTFDFFDYLSLDFLVELRQRNLQTGKTIDQLKTDQELNMARVEELAQVLFLLAVEDVMPERLPELGSSPWLNAWRIDLDPQQWDQGLFRPETPPRDLRPLRDSIRSQFQCNESIAA